MAGYSGARPKLSGAHFDTSFATHMVSDHKKDIKEYEKAAKKKIRRQLRHGEFADAANTSGYGAIFYFTQEPCQKLEGFCDPMQRNASYTLCACAQHSGREPPG